MMMVEFMGGGTGGPHEPRPSHYFLLLQISNFA